MMTEVAKELMSSYERFANENNFYYFVSTLTRYRLSLPYPNTKKEDNETVAFFEVIFESDKLTLEALRGI